MLDDCISPSACVPENRLVLQTRDSKQRSQEARSDKMYTSQRTGNENGRQEYANQGNTSPAQTPSHAYSPSSMRASRPRIPSASGAPQSPQYNRSHPTSPIIARVPIGGPPSHPQDRPSAGYYDPTSDSRTYQQRSPAQVCRPQN